MRGLGSIVNYTFDCAVLESKILMRVIREFNSQLALV